MVSKTDIFLLTSDTGTIESVHSVAENGSPIRIDRVLSEPGQLVGYLNTAGAGVGIIDIDPDPEGMLGELEALVQAHPQLCAMVVSNRMSNDLILSAMLAGARHFLQKGMIRRDLSGVMQRLLRQTQVKKQNGSVLTVFSASGGCGATTVALNLAMELRIQRKKPVLMIDLDRCYGAAASYLALESQYGIADVLTQGERIDRHLIESSSATYLENFHVLLSPSGQKTAAMDAANLRRVIGACRETYAYTVVDAPRLDEETVRELSELSDFTIVVFQMTIKDLKVARSLITLFKQAGLSEDKIIPLANRYEKRSRLVAIDDGKRAIGADRMYMLRSDWRSAMECLNKGKTLAEAAPRSKLRKDYQKLISELGPDGQAKS